MAFPFLGIPLVGSIVGFGVLIAFVKEKNILYAFLFLLIGTSSLFGLVKIINAIDKDMNTQDYSNHGHELETLKQQKEALEEENKLLKEKSKKQYDIYRRQDV
jgi:cell division protein FtsB